VRAPPLSFAVKARLRAQLALDGPNLVRGLGERQVGGGLIQVLQVQPGLLQQRRHSGERGFRLPIALEVGLGVLDRSQHGVEGHLQPVGDEQRLAAPDLGEVGEDGLAGEAELVGLVAALERPLQRLLLAPGGLAPGGKGLRRRLASLVDRPEPLDPRVVGVDGLGYALEGPDALGGVVGEQLGRKGDDRAAHDDDARAPVTSGAGRE
jgi:hypothetical protein